MKLLICLLLLGAQLGAQTPTGRVTGIVFDSVAMAPLNGAVVQLARVDGTATQAVLTSTTDAAGRFTFTEVAVGNYGIGFQHSALSVLGLDAPLRAFRLTDGASLTINLAIPSGPQVRAVACGGTAADSSEGLLAGAVTDAARGAPLSGSEVRVHWVELGLVDKRFKAVPRDMVAPVGDDGMFRLCGIAADAQVQVSVSHAGYRSLNTDLTIPPGGVSRYDVRLVDSALTRGTAAISGKVSHADGTAVSSGQVLLTELGVDAPVTNGSFTLAGLPSGTWSLETRVIGYEPQVMLVDAVEGAPATVAIKVANKVQMLDAVQVYGKANNVEMKTLAGILDRKRTAFGTTFLPGNNWLESALYVSDVLQTARGFRYLSMDSIVARGCLENTSIMGVSRRLVIMLDGIRFLGDLSELRNQVSIKEVLAVEAYPDPQSIPGVWRTSDACALVAVWTKR